MNQNGAYWNVAIIRNNGFDTRKLGVHSARDLTPPTPTRHGMGGTWYSTRLISRSDSCDNRNPPSSRRSETGGLRHKTDIIGVTSSFDQFLPDSWSDSSFFSTFQNHDRHSKHMELIFIVWQRHLEPLKQHHENIWQKKRQKLTKRLTEYIHNP